MKLKERCISTVNGCKINIFEITPYKNYLSDLKVHTPSIKKIKIIMQILKKTDKNIELLGNNFHTINNRYCLKI